MARVNGHSPQQTIDQLTEQITAVQAWLDDPEERARDQCLRTLADCGFKNWWLASEGDSSWPRLEDPRTQAPGCGAGLNSGRLRYDLGPPPGSQRQVNDLLAKYPNNPHARSFAWELASRIEEKRAGRNRGLR